MGLGDETLLAKLLLWYSVVFDRFPLLINQRNLCEAFLS